MIALTTLGCVGLTLSGGVYLIAIFGFIFGLAYGCYYASVIAGEGKPTFGRKDGATPEESSSAC